jgi:hypothetical protein
VVSGVDSGAGHRRRGRALQAKTTMNERPRKKCFAGSRRQRLEDRSMKPIGIPVPTGLHLP